MDTPFFMAFRDKPPTINAKTQTAKDAFDAAREEDNMSMVCRRYSTEYRQRGGSEHSLPPSFGNLSYKPNSSRKRSLRHAGGVGAQRVCSDGCQPDCTGDPSAREHGGDLNHSTPGRGDGLIGPGLAHDGGHYLNSRCGD